MEDTQEAKNVNPNKGKGKEVDPRKNLGTKESNKVVVDLYKSNVVIRFDKE